MADNTDIRRPQDPTKINVNQQWEVDYWCRTLGVTETRLREAVKAVGPLVKDVKRYLGK